MEPENAIPDDGAEMGLNSALILGGVLAMALIAVVGVVYTPEKTTEILGFCGMITGTLLLMLKQDQDTKRMAKRIDDSDQKTVKEAAEVKRTLHFTDADKSAKLQVLETKMDAVLNQTNGALDEKFKSVEQKMEAAASKVIEALPKVIEEVVPKVIPPGNEK